jgi:hypothetical protein
VTSYRVLIDELLPPELDVTVGDDEANPGRFFAEAAWDDEVVREHITTRVVNEASLEDAVRTLAAEVRGYADRTQRPTP